MRTPQPLPLPYIARPFAVADALDNGISAGRLRGDDLSRPFWGVRSALASEELLHRCAGLVTRMPGGACFSHATAARLHGIPLPPYLERSTLLDVAVPNPRRGVRSEGVRGHKLTLRRDDVEEIAGLPVTSLARTWCDLGALLPAEDLIVAGDFLIWRRRPDQLRLEPRALAAAIARYPGRRGRVALRAAVPRLSTRSDSPPETKFRIRFEDAGLPRPAVNLEIRDRYGAFVAMVDLAFEQYRESLDYEGDHHRTDREQWEKDLGRVPRLEAEQWHHTRLSGQDLRDSRPVIQRMRALLIAKGWPA